MPAVVPVASLRYGSEEKTQPPFSTGWLNPPPPGLRWLHGEQAIGRAYFGGNVFLPSRRQSAITGPSPFPATKVLYE